MAATTAVQLGVISANKPQLAQGAVILPTAGGTDVTVGEGGQAEAVIPLDRLDEMLSKRKANEAPGEDSMIHLVANLQGQPFLDLIFPATKNRTILIDGGAVV